MSEERKDIKADFEDFVSEKDPVPRRISEQILAAIHRQIYPSRTQLFLKVFTIHLLVVAFRFRCVLNLEFELLRFMT